MRESRKLVYHNFLYSTIWVPGVDAVHCVAQAFANERSPAFPSWLMERLKNSTMKIVRTKSQTKKNPVSLKRLVKPRTGWSQSGLDAVKTLVVSLEKPGKWNCNNSEIILGLVKESRDVICADAEGNLQSNASLCDETRLPELSQACEEEQTQEVN